MLSLRVVVRSVVWVALAVVLVLATPSRVVTADLDRVMNASEARIQLAQVSQKTIEDVLQQTENLESEYKRITKQVDGLEVYIDYIERQISNQESELAQLNLSIDQISDIERQIMPLMIRMLDGLDQFIELDLPFLKNERVERVARLRALMERADVSVAEKFRRLMEAFQIENDFGRTIETYKETLEVEGVTLEVDVLRLGRVGLYYQTTDASATGLWDAATGGWTRLTSGRSRNEVRQGIRIARRQVAPDLLLLDISAPEVAR